MNRFLMTALLVAILSPMLAGQAVKPELNLIPMPKQVDLKAGSFEVPTTLNFIIKGSSGMKNIGLENFATLLKTELGTVIRQDGKGNGKSIRIEKKKDIGLKGGEEAYWLEVEKEGIKITATSEAGVFYAIQTLSQLITANRTGKSIPCLAIKDYPDIPVRGWQDDISRGPIPTMDFLEKEVSTLAAYKLNAITLYTEHVFKMKKHPTLAPDDGITEEQIAELSAYAAGYHVQVIGNFQSFGHMEKILSKPGYEHLAESGHILTPTKEESYQFMKEVY